MVKAEIINKVTNKHIPCMFNPKEYTLAKQNQWNISIKPGHSVPEVKFSGGGASSLKLQLLFDTREEHQLTSSTTSGAGVDVRDYTEALWDLMRIAKPRKDERTQTSTPPHCIFKWGPRLSFEAVVESLSEKFVLFDGNGTPIRAIVDISFKQLTDESTIPKQNPTSGGTATARLYTIQEGDTLAWIAHQMYGDSTVWRHLAMLNQIDDPRRLRAGQTLLVEPLPLP